MGNFEELEGWGTAADALREDDIYHLGIYAGRERHPLVPLDLEGMAVETGAFADEDGVDCDRDGRIDRSRQSPDVQPNGPLVCMVAPPPEGGRAYFDGEAMADPIMELVRAIKDRGPVSLVELGASGVVSRIEPAVHDDLDLRAAHRLPFDVTYSCAPQQLGHTIPVRLGLQVRNVVKAEATALVVCGTIPRRRTSRRRAVQSPTHHRPSLRPLRRSRRFRQHSTPCRSRSPSSRCMSTSPPRLSRRLSPKPRAKRQAQSQSQMQAQAGLVAQRQEQSQAALVRAADQLRERMAMESAMSRLSSEKTPPVDLRYAAGGAALMMMSAWAYGWARARRLQRAWVRR